MKDEYSTELEQFGPYEVSSGKGNNVKQLQGELSRLWDEAKNVLVWTSDNAESSKFKAFNSNSLGIF